MKFVKMHGLGNDFIIIENLDNRIVETKDLTVRLCDRHTGIGADGILLVEESRSSDIKMRIINSDGSEADMCGNGIRCFAKYVYEKGIVKSNSINIETLAGNMVAEITVDVNNIMLIKINMGRPVFEKELIPFAGSENNLNYSINLNGISYKASTILMGVPHTVIYVEDISEELVVNIGRQIETLALFPKRTNVNFIKIVDNERIEIRTWERGAGITLACGTGTCGSVVAAAVNGYTKNKVEAILPIGSMNIEYLDGNVYMEGPAEFVFEGSF